MNYTCNNGFMTPTSISAAHQNAISVAVAAMARKNSQNSTQQLDDQQCQLNMPIPSSVYYNSKQVLHEQMLYMQHQQQQQQQQQFYQQQQFQPQQQIDWHQLNHHHHRVFENTTYSYQWPSLVLAQQQQIVYTNWQNQLQMQCLQQNLQQQPNLDTVTNDTDIDSENSKKPKKKSKSQKKNKTDEQDNSEIMISPTTTSTTNNDEDEPTTSPWRIIQHNAKDDTVQRNSSKVSHNNHNHNNHHHHRKSRKDQQHQNHQQLMKNDSSDSGISINGQQNHHQNQHQHQHQQQQQQQQNRNSTKSCKTRCTNKRQDGQQRSPQKRATSGFSMDDWLENGEMALRYYERRRFISSSDEDKLGHRHNTAHRNSTSSETAPSEDLTTSSSNEDLRDTSYTVSTKTKKNISKSRQRRQQQKRKKQLSESGNSNHDENEDVMDVDINNLKENCRPAAGGNTQRSNAKNLRQECTKNAALKAAANACPTTKGTHKGNGVLKNSNPSTPTKRSSSSSSSASLPASLCVSNSSSSSVENSPTASPTTCKRSAENIKKIALQLAPPLRAHMNLNFTESETVQHMRRYLIDPNLLRVYGYPVESAIHEGCIEIYKCLPKPANSPVHHHHNHQQHHQQQLRHHHSQRYVSNTSVINANDGLCINITTCLKEEQKQEWIIIDDASNSSSDSGQGSGNSSPPSMDSDTSEGAEDEPTATTALYTPDGSYQIFSQYDQSMEKQCVRCNTTFHVTEMGEYLSREPCTFHWGKLNEIYSGDKGYCFQYTCCQGDQESQGCVFNELHVWTGAVVGLNGPYTDFVHTRPRYDSTKPTKVYALDCEMSFTGRGLEVTKVTVVGYDGQMVYEHFVRPDAEIADYNTRFSGVTEKDLSPNSNNSVKTLTEVQRDLLRLIDADTILIGHGLDNDLRVLRIVHKTVIDTSICFPHASGFPYRRSLKHLTKVYLNRDIQTSDLGHSSFEDSRACIELMLWKMRKEMRYY